MRADGLLAGLTGPGSRIVNGRLPLAFTEGEIEQAAAVESGLSAERARDD